jgi:hypothetical protein
MTVATVLGLLAIVLLAVALVRTRARLARVEARTVELEAHLQRRIEPDVAAARAEAHDASVTARRATAAAGIDDHPNDRELRLPFEPVTGRVVRAVAFGAGAKRAIARAAPGLSRTLRRSA